MQVLCSLVLKPAVLAAAEKSGTDISGEQAEEAVREIASIEDALDALKNIDEFLLCHVKNKVVNFGKRKLKGEALKRVKVWCERKGSICEQFNLSFEEDGLEDACSALVDQFLEEESSSINEETIGKFFTEHLLPIARNTAKVNLMKQMRAWCEKEGSICERFGLAFEEDGIEDALVAGFDNVFNDSCVSFGLEEIRKFCEMNLFPIVKVAAMARFKVVLANNKESLDEVEDNMKERVGLEWNDLEGMLDGITLVDLATLVDIADGGGVVWLKSVLEQEENKEIAEKTCIHIIKRRLKDAIVKLGGNEMYETLVVSAEVFDECKVFDDYLEIASPWLDDEVAHFELFEVIVEALEIEEKALTFVRNTKKLF